VTGSGRPDPVRLSAAYKVHGAAQPQPEV